LKSEVYLLVCKNPAGNLEEEKKLIEAGFDYVRYSDKDEVAIYRKRK
jgi:hypothetical protein